MTSEQAQGKPVDKRTDIWSFGVVLFEMLSGRRAFQGRDVSHIIVHVLEQEPDWSRLPPLPPGVQGLLERCLQKDSSRRLRDIGDLRIQIEAALTHPIRAEGATSNQARSARSTVVWVVAVFAVITAGVIAFLYLRRKPAAAEAVRFEIVQPDQVNFSSLVSVSPDGRTLAFIATGAAGVSQLWVRSLETLEARPLDGTDGANGAPFWSPDSRNIVFGTSDKLKRIEVSGGPAQTLSTVPNQVWGGFWTSDNRIVFGLSGPGNGLFEVPATGGAATALTSVDTGFDISPVLLPDGRHFVYEHFGMAAGTDSGIFLGALDAKPGEQHPTKLLPYRSLVNFVGSPEGSGGYLLFVRTTSDADPGTLVAQAFNTKTLQLEGEVFPIADKVANVGFTASRTSLVYRAGQTSLPTGGGPATPGQLTWFDRQGKVLGTVGNPDIYVLGIPLSPDGTRMAAAHGGENVDIWILDLARGVPTRFTSDPALDFSPVWSPDGSEIVFASQRNQEWNLYRRAANGGSAEELFFKPGLTGASALPTAWSRDGRFLVYTAVAGGKADIWVLSMSGSAGDRKAVPLVKTMFNERGGQFSPDGRWFSYTSDDTGKDEAYVRPFDPASMSSHGEVVTVSKGGGISPHWNGNGKELFYAAPDGTIMSVQVTTGAGFHAGIPKPLFKGPPGVAFWNVTRDGQKFLIPVPQSATSPYKVVLNWTSTLKK
ncbi:MAG: protein kinase [Acidobacteriia bacterium]|nr:protein kinase [Terriglobia bacterium]